MAAQKVYQIQINGLTESVKAVDALNESLKTLEARIKALEGKTVSVGSSSSGGGSKSPSTSSLSEEAKLEKQIQQLEEKRVAHSKEIYQNYLAAKDVLKETENDQKQIAASERLAAKTYSNTVSGMKQELADIKQVMQTVDLGDADQLNNMVNRAKELNDKLKEIEQSYGQFSRNVGNYSSAFDGIQKLSVTVGGTVREFTSAREASRTLRNELVGLEAAGSGNTEVAKELRSEYYKLVSAMDDATKSSKAMDEAMDFMQSFTSIASIGNGLQAFFGFDETEIQRSIQKLVALQNVLQGIETLRKQMETKEGIGKIFGEGNEAIDTFISNITGAQMGVDGLATATKRGTLAVRGLSLALKGLGVGLAIAAISYAVEGLQKLISSLDTTKVKEEALEREANALNRLFEERKNLLSGSFMAGTITAEEYLKEQYRLENQYIQDQIDLLKERASLANDRSWFVDAISPSGEYNTGSTGQKINGTTSVASWNTVSTFSYDVKQLEEAEEAWKKLNAAVKNGHDYFTEYGEGLNDWVSSIITTVQQTEDVMKGMGNIVLSNTIGEFEELNKKFKNGEVSSKEFAEALKDLTNKMNSSEVLNSVIANLDKYIPDDEVRQKAQNILEYIGKLNDEFNMVSETQIHHWNQVRIDAMEEGKEKIAAQMAEDERHEIAQYAHTEEQKQLIQAKYQRKRLDETKKYNKKISGENKRHQKEVLEAERDLANLRISTMKEGLNKVLKQLEEERKQRLKKVEADGILVGERQVEINKLYDKKILDAKKEWAEKVKQIYNDLWDGIFAYSLETTEKIANTIEQSIEIRSDKLENSLINFYNQAISSYGVQGKNQLSKSTQIELQFVSTGTDKFSKDMKQMIDLWRQSNIETDKYGVSIKNLQLLQTKLSIERKKLTEEEKKLSEEEKLIINEKIAEYEREIEISKEVKNQLKNNAENSLKTFVETREKLVEEYGKERVERATELLMQENYSKDISTLYKQRNTAIENYWSERIAFELTAAESNYEAQKLLENERYEDEKRANAAHTEEIAKQAKKAFEEGKLSEKESQEIMERIMIERNNRELALQEKHSQNLQQLEIEKNNKIKQVNGEAYQERLQELRDFQTAIANLEEKQPVFNNWGIINLSKTNKNNENLLNSYQTLANQIVALKQRLQTQLDAEEISFDDFQNANRELDRFAENVGEKMDKVKYDLSLGAQVSSFVQSIQQYLQEGLNAFNTIMNAVWDAQDNQFDKQQEALQKENEMLEEKLEEQQELFEKHKSAVDSIEDELATARGDRRQHLIDQLNAEMEAQRAAQREEQRIQKEKEKNEKKQDDLERERKKAQYKRDQMQAIVNGAMAVTYAAMNHWPIPAIPMMSLAAATTATQLAIMAANKPYRTGGQLEGGLVHGKRHSQGGVPVGNTGIEVEGSEFIIRRESTSPNLGLLDFINKSQRKLNLNDFIDFYSDKPKKVIKNIQKRTYADGGYLGNLPTLSYDININDRLIDSFERYASKPSVVQVVDIINKTDDINRVRVLAGLTD